MSPKRLISWVFALIVSFVLVTVVMPILVLAVLMAVPTLFGTGDLQPSDKHVAVIELDGVILETREILEELYRQADRDSTKGIVLRINSPGGAVGPSQEIYSAVSKLKAKKPIVASMGAIAASGGLYAALSASKIFAQPGTLTGSIGVVLQVPKVKQITDQIGFQMEVIKSGEFKDTGNAFREMTERDRELLQTTVDHAYADFVEAVVESRALPEEKVRTFADGRVILGSDALQYGLIDAIGDVHDAARAVFELSGQPLGADEDLKLFYPLDRMKYFRSFLKSVAKLPQLLELTPRLEYRM